MPDDCPICLEPIDELEGDVCVTKCKHRFHTSCLCKAFVIKSGCPICRSQIAAAADDTNTGDYDDISHWLAEVIARSVTINREPRPRNQLFRPRISWYRSAPVHPTPTYPAIFRAQIIRQRLNTPHTPTVNDSLITRNEDDDRDERDIVFNSTV